MSLIHAGGHQPCPFTPKPGCSRVELNSMTSDELIKNPPLNRDIAGIRDEGFRNERSKHFRRLPESAGSLKVFSLSS
jgi:hypothetical protein